MSVKATSEPRRVVYLDPKTSRSRRNWLGRFKSPRQVDGHCVSLVAPESYESGQYLRLRYAIEARRTGPKGMVVGICSPAAGDGKSLTTMNLAGSLAQRKSSRILIIDADLRRKSEVLRNLVPLPGALAPGLSEVLMSVRRPRIEDAARRLAQTNIWVLLTGTLPIAPYEAFSSERFGELIESARSNFDYVIVDAPPVIAVPDCKVLEKWVDGLVMVVAANETPRMLLGQALEIMGPEKIMGLLLNKTDQLPKRYYRYYGNYGYATRAKVGDIGHIAEVSVDDHDESDKGVASDVTVRP